MHEIGLAQEIVEMVTRRAGGARVSRVVVEVGKLSAVLPDALRFAFELCCEDTALAGAQLEIIEVPGRASCARCDTVVLLDRAYGRCGCGSSDLTWISGDELKVKAMEVS
jgi:hydrogenase nickel incorporation protein HypA/HybF